jgi:hypothetical protein
MDGFSMMKLSNYKTSAPNRRKSGESKEKLRGASKNWTRSELGQSETRPPLWLMMTNTATKDGRTADRLSEADSFDARLAAEGKSDGRVVYRTIDSQNPPG